MTYAGWNPSYRTFQQVPFVATGGETVIPIKGVPESVLYKNGLLLVPDLDYTVNYTTGAFTLVVPAVNGDKYQILNLSTYHMADTYTRDQADKLSSITLFATATNAAPLAVPGSLRIMIDMDCSAGPANATLPQVPKKGIVIHFRDKLDTINTTNKFTVKRFGGAGTIMGIAEDMDVTLSKCSFSMVWNGSDWRVF